MKKELMSILAISSLWTFAPPARAQTLTGQNTSEQNTLGQSNLGTDQPVICTHETISIMVRILSEKKIGLYFSTGATAALNFVKLVQPNGIVYFQYKGKTTGLDAKNMTAYLSPAHDVLLLPHSDERTGTYTTYSCQELVEQN